MTIKSNQSAKLTLFLSVTMTLVSANAAYGERDDFFDVEPESSTPKPQAEAPRPIRMEIHDNEEISQKKAGKFSLFKRSAEPRKQIASKDKDNDTVKDVPEEDNAGGISNAKSVSKSAAGVMCGLVVGVPVRAAKTMASETKRMNTQITRDLTWTEGQKPDLTARAFGAALSVPYGIATGLMTGLIKGTERAVHAGGRRPLSKESMSITDPEFK
ncbi:MAG: hypothetical protein IT342_13845 [Candidatus Melainabacteria bacterium]|nr:hypothetical protein [Candidatus Melainabacteria bacterium]